MTPILEVCCGSLQSAIEAVEGGAKRIELCAALALDGLTPSLGTLTLLRRRYPDLLIHVLIRPREGDFVYTPQEIEVMIADTQAAVRAGASAIVSGALTPDGDIDLPATERFLRAAAPLPFTFHRAFDHVRTPLTALAQLQRLGVQRILTSGAAPTAEQGIPLLRQLIGHSSSHAGGAQRTVILPGGGINSHNAPAILAATGATELHASCSRTLPDGSRQTSAEEVRALLNAM